jgi:hypothetical protein
MVPPDFLASTSVIIPVAIKPGTTILNGFLSLILKLPLLPDIIFLGVLALIIISSTGLFPGVPSITLLILVMSNPLFLDPSIILSADKTL